MTFLLTFSVIGWGVNLFLKDSLHPLAFFPISFVAAVICGVSSVKLLAEKLGRFLKPIESSAIGHAGLSGCVGTACLPISSEFGQAFVHDVYGSLHKVTCRVHNGCAPISKGEKILLVRYVRPENGKPQARGYYEVEPYEAAINANKNS
jgi:hypothetical protein